MHDYEYLQIEGITLLSIVEAEKLPHSIRDCGKRWWLRSPRPEPRHITYVQQHGDINYRNGASVYLNNGGVRPALIIPELEDLDLEKFKDSVEIFDLDWIYIGDGMVLAEEPIFYSRFDEKSNNYEASEIKQKLERWLDQQVNNGN